MRYRIITTIGKGSGTTYYMPQVKFKYWPFWFNLSRTSSSTVCYAESEIKADKKIRNFKSEVVYSE